MMCYVEQCRWQWTANWNGGTATAAPPPPLASINGVSLTQRSKGEWKQTVEGWARERERRLRPGIKSSLYIIPQDQKQKEQQQQQQQRG